MANYLNDDELYYEIKLSQGKGFLTNKATLLLIKLADNMIRTKQYYDMLNKDDSYQQGIERLLRNWKNFNCKKYHKALPYFTEVFKRGMAEGFNETQNGYKGKLTLSINDYIK